MDFYTLVKERFSVHYDLSFIGCFDACNTPHGKALSAT